MSASIDQRQCFSPGSSVPWHAHRHGYAAIVIGGGYTEAGHGGRRRVGAGDVIVHAPFSAHSDRFDRHGAEIVNLPLDSDSGCCLVSGRVADPELLLSEIRDHSSDICGVLSAHIMSTPGETEIVDLLAADLDKGMDRPLPEWALEHRIAVRTLRRHFSALYSISPARYRARARAWRAWRQIASERTSLAALAYDLGFSDQAHMSRAVWALTGATPQQWRRSSGKGLAV